MLEVIQMRQWGHQAYESLVAQTAMVYDHLKILIYNRAAQGWYLSFFNPSAGCWIFVKDLVALTIHEGVNDTLTHP